MAKKREHFPSEIGPDGRLIIPDDAYLVCDPAELEAWDGTGSLKVRVVMPGTAEHARMTAEREIS